ncbi:MAG TPA: nucleotidyltransferase family protein, partial [Pyrinomonadaceae bacterium]|nr:nucleotidyltransferase family protein [Pyrinomonadaceae bacterium]
PEAQLLLCCARTRLDAANAERIITRLQENIDWRYLLQMAFRHNLAPLLYRSLDAVAPTRVPETVRAELKQRIQIDIQGNLFLTKELLHLLALFNQHGIPVLPYKGPVLAASVYGDLALRPSNDLDILVHERDILQATDLLVSCGYEIIRPPSVAQAGKGLQSLRVTQLVEKSPWAYQLVLWHPDRQVVVELHWRITPQYVFPGSPEPLWEDLQAVPLGGVTVHSLAAENLLWFLCVHGTKHQWRRLSWLCDIAELIRAYPNLDWERIVAQAARSGIERRLYLGLLLANCLLKTPLPRAIETSIHAAPYVKVLARQVVERVFDGTEQAAGFPYLERFAFQLRAIDHMADRGRYLLRFAKGKKQT